MKFLAGLLVGFLTWTTIVSGAQVGPMTPLYSEELPTSLGFSQECQQVSIVEWRTDGSDQTSAQPSVIIQLDQVCQTVVKNFAKFIATQKEYQLSSKIDNFHQFLSILPINSKPRNLNDSESRFANRSKSLDENGEVIPVLGYHQRAASFVYLYNLIIIEGQLDAQFRTVLAHELFHALSYQFGIYQQHSENKDQKEEEMAVKFTIWLGWGS